MALPSFPDIKLGLHNRLAPSLVTDFYPDGMPDDWRANYLALTTQAIWVREEDPDVHDVLAAISDAPKPVRLVWFGDDRSPVLATWRQAQPNASVLMLSPQTPIWSPEQIIEQTITGARVGLLPECAQPATLRAWLEAFAKQAPEGACALFITGETPSVATLNRAQTLLELLGW